eukprot:CAMPEP_0198227572 /NCGR_PEP_ID=MMETSP1445-20131203/109743_1 /TAXON_ID=36898 /ORGANISM="Pyramimonas sp., Strain CCMP2087" /LENGTH=232 /DNA_ID=CAMNT_0043907669 /DNA_START=118 /DNA_END=815 /DNA_ORIENTATION=+
MALPQFTTLRFLSCAAHLAMARCFVWAKWRCVMKSRPRASTMEAAARSITTLDRRMAEPPMEALIHTPATARAAMAKNAFVDPVISAILFSSACVLSARTRSLAQQDQQPAEDDQAHANDERRHPQQKRRQAVLLLAGPVRVGGVSPPVTLHLDLELVPHSILPEKFLALPPDSPQDDAQRAHDARRDPSERGEVHMQAHVGEHQLAHQVHEEGGEEHEDGHRRGRVLFRKK